VITTGQVTIGTASSVLCLVPPGPCTVVLSNIGTASPVWVGAGTAVVAGAAGTAVGSGNGFPVPSGAPVAFTGYRGGAGTTLVAACSSGSASVGYLISTATGQTGP
jgi:hypothetical protein